MTIVLFLDTPSAVPRTPPALQRYAEESHELFLDILSRKNALGDIDPAAVTKMFSYGGQYCVTTGLLTMKRYLDDAGIAQTRYLHVDELQAVRGRLAQKDLAAALSEADIVAITCATPNADEALALAKTAKQSGCFVVLGGPHVTFMDAETLVTGVVDAVVRGEGERSLLMLVQGFANGDWKSTPGISYLDAGRLIRTPPQTPLAADEIPSPDYSALPQNCAERFILSVSGSRGCPFNCYFCSETNFWSHNVRLRPVERFLDDIEELGERFPNRIIHLSDSNFPSTRRYLKDFLSRIVRREKRFLLSANIRADIVLALSEEELHEMRDAGFVELLLGVESAHPAQLERMNKKETFQQMITALAKLRDAGFPIIKTYWIVGFPGETAETLDASINGLRELFEQQLCDYAICKLYIPYPGTRPFHEPERFGLTLDTGQWSRFERFSYPPPYTLDSVTHKNLLETLTQMERIQRDSLRSIAAQTKMTVQRKTDGSQHNH